MAERRIPINGRESIRMKPAESGTCAVHDWPTEGLARRLVAAMRASHPRGIDVCRPCISRAKEDADAARSAKRG